jgi:hypothetical protein
MKRGIVLVLAVIMITVPCGYVHAEGMDKQVPVQENSQDDIPIIIDVLILRPVGLATCVLGLAASIVAMPFAIPSNSTGKVYRALIAEPFYYTFKRPLGKNRSMDEDPGSRPLQ